MKKKQREQEQRREFRQACLAVLALSGASAMLAYIDSLPRRRFRPPCPVCAGSGAVSPRVNEGKCLTCVSTGTVTMATLEWYVGGRPQPTMGTRVDMLIIDDVLAPPAPPPPPNGGRWNPLNKLGQGKRERWMKDREQTWKKEHQK